MHSIDHWRLLEDSSTSSSSCLEKCGNKVWLCMLCSECLLAKVIFGYNFISLSFTRSKRSWIQDSTLQTSMMTTNWTRAVGMPLFQQQNSIRLTAVFQSLPTSSKASCKIFQSLLEDITQRRPWKFRTRRYLTIFGDLGSHETLI